MKQKFSYVGLQKLAFCNIWLENKYSALLKGGILDLRLWNYINSFPVTQCLGKNLYVYKSQMLEFHEIKIRGFHTLKIYRCAGRW